MALAGRQHKLDPAHLAETIMPIVAQGTQMGEPALDCDVRWNGEPGGKINRAGRDARPIVARRAVSLQHDDQRAAMPLLSFMILRSITDVLH